MGRAAVLPPGRRWYLLPVRFEPRRRPPMDPTQIALIKQLRSEGRTLMAIAKEIGCSDCTVYKYTKPPKPPPPSKPKRTMALEMLLRSQPPSSSPPTRFSSSVPINRPIVWADRQKIQPTKSELER